MPGTISDLVAAQVSASLNCAQVEFFTFTAAIISGATRACL
jgi:hypothetical protein